MINDYKSIIQWHPEMILISEKPVTWKGFLKVSCNSGRNMRIKLKLIVHNYPSLCDAEINFGKEIAFIRNKEFSEKVKNLMHNVNKISIFLKQLQLLISNFINNRYIIEDNRYEAIDNQAMEILKEIKDVLDTSSGIQILSNNNLNIIKLSLNNIAIKLQRINHRTYSWTVVDSDLPEIPALGPFKKNISTLIIARNILKLQVEILEKTWSNLKQIDENCWIVDPLQPKPYHLYRRIYLTPSLSMYIKINPLNPMDLPEITFMGSDTEVKSKKELISKKLHNWNPNHDILNNLKMLLDIDTFLKKEINKESTEDNNAIVADEECCICFSLQLDNETLPDKICSNEKCKRHFHTSCLLRWLQTIVGNHVIFDHIHGSCPNCKESISCYIK
ncbi:E3 ubiquitin-protein ligase FANCL isoform X2 [Apis florea]|nr:E3 ubiquitin-protein ligase FANCL isoform X2 [Apis florea]